MINNLAVLFTVDCVYKHVRPNGRRPTSSVRYEC